MEKFTSLSAIVAPLPRANVDTDAIIPKQFLKSIKRTGFGPHLFDSWRFLDEGRLGVAAHQRKPNPEFVLNHDRFKAAKILLTGSNFGCGSSREHAPWALLDYGFRVIIAVSFADIFYNNCFKNGLLAITMPEAQVEAWFNAIAANQLRTMTVDLASQSIQVDHGETVSFTIDAFRKECLMNGLDDIGLTLQHADDIKAYETRRRGVAPWLFRDLAE